MILYNVTISIDKRVESEWLRWMKSVHIPQVMATGCFQEYRMLKMLHEDNMDSTSYAIQYLCAGLEEIRRYQAEYAEALQQEHSLRYPNLFASFRSLLEVV
jgi:hypothetical protein